MKRAMQDTTAEDKTAVIEEIRLDMLDLLLSSYATPNKGGIHAILYCDGGFIRGTGC